MFKGKSLPGGIGGKSLLLALAMAAGAALPSANAVARSPDEIVYPAYHGPRKIVAVSKFDATGAFAATYGGWDIGGGLAAMLAGELARTNRFVVVERGDVDTLLRERQMAQSGTARGASDVPLAGVQTFIRGSVTEFEQQEKGGGLNFGLNFGGVSGVLGGRKTSGHITIDFQLIDAGTGAVLSRYKVEKRISSTTLGLEARAGVLTAGSERFAASPIGRVAREAIAEAAARMVAGMEQVPWQALVANVEEGRVYINAGRNANLAPGARMRAVRRTRTITDPVTGEILGGEQRTVSELVIDSVEDRYAIGRLVSAEAPLRGDTVQLVTG